jgi:hypothetical protein
MFLCCLDFLLPLYFFLTFPHSHSLFSFFFPYFFPLSLLSCCLASLPQSATSRPRMPHCLVVPCATLNYCLVAPSHYLVTSLHYITTSSSWLNVSSICLTAIALSCYVVTLLHYLIASHYLVTISPHEHCDPPFVVSLPRCFVLVGTSFLPSLLQGGAWRRELSNNQ